MAKINQEFLTRIKGKYTEKYATEMDNWTAILLNEIHDNIMALKTENAQSMQISTKLMEAAAAKIEGQINQVRFDSEKQAFFYGLGKHLLYGIVGLIAVSSIVWIYSTQSDYVEKQAFVDAYPSVEKFESIYKRGRTINQNGYEFLVVYPVNGEDVEFARNYLYDKKNGRVLIPIGTK
jgi:hypothetical protein